MATPSDPDPRAVDDEGVTRVPCPACGSMMREDMTCTNDECPNGAVSE